jgi:hypothetical protein
MFAMMSLASTAERMVDVERTRSALGLDERLAAIPGHAAIRGFYFRQTSEAVARSGGAAVAVYRHLSPTKSRWFFRMYSLRDYLEDLAAGAAAIDPLDPSSAIRSIWRNTTKYAPLFNAQRFLSLLNATPLDAMKWLEPQRDMFLSYGGWRIERRDDHYFVVHYWDEYIWLDSAHRGGLEGMLEACSVNGNVEVDLDSPFNGRIHVRWQPRA